MRVVAFLTLVSPATTSAAPSGKAWCGRAECPRSILMSASLFGEDERRTEREFARQRNLSLSEVQNRYAASGAIICRSFGKGRSGRSVVYASGQLTVRSNLITTTAHTFIGKDARPLGRLENCVFETRVDGRKVSSRLTSDYIVGFRDPLDASFAGFDWAVIRLRRELPVEPYQVDDDLSQLFRWLDVANVTKVANFNFDNWGPRRTRTKSLADCAIKPEIIAWSSGVRGLRTDCDISPGNSGGAVLSEISGKPKLVGIMVGTTAKSFRTRKQFDFYSDYNIGALVEGEFLRAIRDMATDMSVSRVQILLARLGYEPGPADGVAGKVTRRAIRAFQKDNGLDPTGSVSSRLSLMLSRAVSGDGSGETLRPESDLVVADLYNWRASAVRGTELSPPGWADAQRRSAGFGPRSAWTNADFEDCRNVIACLKRGGAPDQALGAAYVLEKTGLVGSYVQRFQEFGLVDLVNVAFSYKHAGGIEYALVNGLGGAMSMRSGDVRKSMVKDRSLAVLRKEYPGAEVRFNPRFEAYRLLPDGGQRFVFAYPVTTGCLACRPVAQLLIAYDFDDDGRLARLQPLAGADIEEGLEWFAQRTYGIDRLIADTAVLQRRLNGLGYAAGPIDGDAGKTTLEALRQFQADHGLAATGKVDRPTARALATDRAGRQVRRFETLLMARKQTATAFGLGLLNRFRGFPDTDLVLIANNLAGRYIEDDEGRKALLVLQQARKRAWRVRDRRPLLYASVLLNLASGSISAGEADEAEAHVREAAKIVNAVLAGATEAGQPAAIADAAGTLPARLAMIGDALAGLAEERQVRFSLAREDGAPGYIFTLGYSAPGGEKI